MKWLLLLFLTSPLAAQEPTSSESLIIYTYGKAELLHSAIDALSHILYSGGPFKTLLKVALLIGAFAALCLAFFRQRFAPLIRQFLLPGLFIAGLIVVPSTQVRIVGTSSSSEKPVQVPFLLGIFASYASQALHHLQELIPLQSRWIAQCCAEEKEFTPFAITPSLDRDARTFCRECLFYDQGLGLYKQDIASEPDLFSLFSSASSEQRKIFCNGERISCREAAIQLSERFDEEKTKRPLLFGRDHLKQRMMLDLIQQAMGKPSSVMGADLSRAAVYATVLLRNVLEALLYLGFPLALLLSLLSFGVRLLLRWMRLILWVSLWPFFFSGIDLLLSGLWIAKKETAITLTNLQAMMLLYDQICLLACLSVALVPFLTYLFLKMTPSPSSSPAPVPAPAPIQKVAPPPIFMPSDAAKQPLSFEEK